MFFYSSNDLASKKGGNTSIATWNFKDNTNKTISLADTITSSMCDIPNNCIAPGTEGRFDIIINAEGSNLKISYDVNLVKEENTPSNLYFFTKTNPDEKFYTLTDLFKKVDFSGTFNSNDKKIKIYEIYWVWPFEMLKEDGTINEQNDIDDTNFAKENRNYIFEIEVSGMQSI